MKRDVNAYMFGTGVLRGRSTMSPNWDGDVAVDYLYELGSRRGYSVLSSNVDATMVVQSKFSSLRFVDDAGASWDIVPSECTDAALDDAVNSKKRSKTKLGVVTETEVWKNPVDDTEFLEETAGCTRGLRVLRFDGASLSYEWDDTLFPTKERVSSVNWENASYDEAEKARMNEVFVAEVSRRPLCKAVVMDGEDFRSSTLLAERSTGVVVPNPTIKVETTQTPPTAIEHIPLSINDFLFDRKAFKANFLIDHVCEPVKVSEVLTAMLEQGWLFDGQVVELTFSNRRRSQWTSEKAMAVFQHAFKGFFHLSTLAPFTYYKDRQMAWGVFEVCQGPLPKHM